MNSSFRLAPVFFLLAFFITAGMMWSQSDEGLVVQISTGRIRGMVSGATVIYKGIPFGQPPVGALRWQPPQPVSPWQEIRDAKAAGNSCMQAPYGIAGFSFGLATVYGGAYKPEPLKVSEDCLYLNVWAPSSSPRRPLPVMVFVHGGSNTSGSGSQPMYDGTALVAKGVVIVTVNYRLGVFGFFSHPELTAQSPHHSSGNYGLLDQIAALKWVQQNIGKFGGDPRNVTIFGESAGSINVTQLIVSPLSKGLFHRVIGESGPPFGLAPAQTLTDAEALGTALGAAAQPNGKLKDLLELPAAAIEKLAAKVLLSKPKDTSSFSASVVDGWVLPKSSQNAYATGAIQKVDLMIGLNGREWSVFRIGAQLTAKSTKPKEEENSAALSTVADTIRPLYGTRTNEAISKYLTEIRTDPDQGLDHGMTDLLAGCPIGAAATLTRARGQKVFVYKFNRIVPGKGAANLGAFHALELPYIFGAFADPSWRWLPITDVDRTMSVAIQNYWTNFAKTGNPNASELSSWPVWNNEQEPFLEFTEDGAIKAQRKYSPPLCDLTPAKLKAELSK